VPASGDSLFACGRGDDTLSGIRNALPGDGDEVSCGRYQVPSEANVVSGV
jgi:hypothetical protein